MKTNSEKGFTLIEILITITIIGVLSSVVVGALSTAREKGQDATIKSMISSVRSEAEILYDDTGSYATFCTEIVNFTTSLEERSLDVTCIDAVTLWAIEARLNAEDGFFCTDYTNISTTTATTSIADGSDFVCG